MKEYFLGLIVFAFAGSVILSLAPSGAGKGYIRLLCGLCSVGCIVFPLFGLISGEGVEANELLSMLDGSERIEENSVEIYNDAIDTATLENAELNLKAHLIKELKAKTDSLDAKIVLGESNGEKYIERVKIYIYPSGYAIAPEKIKAATVDLLNAECELIYK